MKNTFTKTLTLGLLLLGALSLKAQTSVPALITTNQVWDISGSPYNLSQNTFIDQGVSVKIMPGVEVLTPNGTVKLMVDGELQAHGTVDSMIHMDSVQIEFMAKAVSYDSATGAGAYFNYCYITPSGIGKRGIYVAGIDAKIENCTFYNTYYGIYVFSGSQSSNKVEILNCVFDDYTGTSFPIYSSGQNADLIVRGNQFNNFGGNGGMYLYGRTLLIQENVFNGQNRININAFGSSFINCNEFKNLRFGVQTRSYIKDSTSTFEFTHNTLDSIGYAGWTNAMLSFSPVYDYSIPQVRFNYNNFLSYLGTGVKVDLSAGNPTPTTSIPVDLKKNYWVSTDSTTIEGFIMDYNDDIKLLGRADFSGLLVSEDTTCEDPEPSSCEASFYLAIDTSNLYNVFVVNTSTGTTSNTTYTWDFGDNSTSTQENPTHSYGDFGKFRLCLTLYNANENCSSTFCDSIGLDSNGNLYKNGAFTIQVLRDWELTSITSAEDFGAVKVYPNPSKGHLMIEVDEASNEQGNIEVFDMAGKMVISTNAFEAGSRFTSLDLSELTDGIYLVRLKQGQKIYTTKIAVNR